MKCYTSHQAINCLVEATFIFNIAAIYRVRGIRFQSFVLSDSLLYSYSPDEFDLTTVDCKQRLDFIYLYC